MVKNIYPKNKTHFKKLIPITKKVLMLLNKNKINAVIYSSYALFYHTKDENLKVNDVDILIKKKDFPRAVDILKANNLKFKYLPEWKTIEIKHNKIKISIDSLFKGCKGIKEGTLPKKFIKINFYGTPSKIMTIKDLYNSYLSGYRSTEYDKVKLGKKVNYIKNFLKK